METMLLHMEDPDDTGGVLYVTVGDTAFPEEGWYDLVDVDLENWLPGLLSFARGHADSCILQFMDAPAAVRLTRHNESIFSVCLWNHKPQIMQTEIDFPAFLDSVAKCLRRYNRVMHQQGKLPRFESELSIIRKLIK